ncbi:MAG: type II toxin-antitoxin system HicA family toxin [Oscillospiraceae bacterium]|nr:type II toxin-antitoxin system HicA family toxin [Oscillospiraceae bacterium]
MSKLTLLNAKELEKLLFELGFVKKRQKGSHVSYQHPDGRTTSIPFHSAKELKRPLLCGILKQAKISVDEYNELIK